MPRSPSSTPTKLLAPGVGVDAIRHGLSPLSNFYRCESAAFIRKAMAHAIHKDIGKVSPYAEFIPTSQTVVLGHENRRSRDSLKAIESEEDIKQAAIEASAQLKKARYFFEQAETVGDEIKPILYYYGGTYFLDFICLNLVRREPGGSPGHGLSVSTDSKGWDFNKDWPRAKCRVQVESSGDFPFYVDALTVGGWASLFSGFRLHKETKPDPFEIRANPAPLFPNKVSLDLICNFDRDKYLKDHPDVEAWLVGSPTSEVWKLTSLLMDVMVVHIAASLARYYTPAWKHIIEGSRDDIYNDVRAAYHRVSQGFALFFEDEYPFQYSYGTRIPSF